MAAIHIKRWDWFFLKTTLLVFFLSAIRYFIDGNWGLGVFLLLAAVFGVGGIGQALYPKLSTKELASGDYISVRPDESASKVGLDHEESHLIIKAMMKLAFLIFVVISVIGFYHDLPLWKTVLFAILWAGVVPAGSFLYFALYSAS